MIQIQIFFLSVADNSLIFNDNVIIGQRFWLTDFLHFIDTHALICHGRRCKERHMRDMNDPYSGLFR